MVRISRQTHSRNWPPSYLEKVEEHFLARSRQPQDLSGEHRAWKYVPFTFVRPSVPACVHGGESDQPEIATEPERTFRDSMVKRSGKRSSLGCSGWELELALDG